MLHLWVPRFSPLNFQCPEVSLANALLVRLLRRDDSDARQNQYDYHPSLAAGVIFVLLFSVLSAIHLGILIKSRIWWTIVSPDTLWSVPFLQLTPLGLSSGLADRLS